MIYLILQVAFASYTISQVDIGCLNSPQNDCTTLCVLGVEDCSSSIPKCEFGYFLFTLGATTDKPPQCVQCPYQTVGEDLVKYCMDCVENPYSWENSRKCTYDYVVGSSIISTGTYQISNREYSELFFVGTSYKQGSWTDSVLSRSKKFKYQVYTCSGCLNFCSVNTEGCNTLTSDYQNVDIDKKGITCLEGYYFKDNQCMSCSIKNCISCTSALCETCQKGYRLSLDQLSCIQCTNNCVTCTTTSESKQQCSSCETNYVMSLDVTQCETCPDGCIRCEYVSFSDNVLVKYPSRSFTQITDTTEQSYYVKYCRQCEQQGDTVDESGYSCYPCPILNCNKCYYSIINAADTTQNRNTLTSDFKPIDYNNEISMTQCAACASGFVINSTNDGCVAIDSSKTIANCLLYSQGTTNYKCILCSSGYVLNNSDGTCYGSCSTHINDCAYCMSYNSLDTVQYYDSSGNAQTETSQQTFQCIICDTGYYADFFTGKCLQCQSYCSTCSQYNQNYNFTEYIYQERIYSTYDKSDMLTTDLEDTYCSQCDTGFILYGNECKGCTSDCIGDNPSKDANDPTSLTLNECYYLSDTAFCGKCFNSNRDRSLTSDLAECQECPYQCLACRDRITSEIERVNLYFNPSNSILTKYSRICYLYDTNTEANYVITYDTQLNMPTKCSYTSGQTKKCTQSASIDVYLYCDSTEYNTFKSSANSVDKSYAFDYTYFYSLSSASTTNITFSTIETLALYQLFNQDTIREVDLYIHLVKEAVDGISTCIFYQDTNFILNLQKNIFSLQQFRVHFIGESDSTKTPYQLQINGILSFPWMYYIEIIGINIQQYLQSNTNSYFGLQISDNILTKVSLKNFQIGRSTSDETSQYLLPMIFLIENVDEMIWSNVQFTNFISGDLFSITNSNSYVTSINYQFSNVIFYQCSFYNMILFQPTQNTNVKIILITLNEFTLNKCYFNNTNVFGESDSNTQSSGSIEFNNIIVKFTKFESSNFLNFKSQNLTTINNLNILRCNFTGTSVLIKSNSFIIQNVFSDSTIFYSGCRLFQNSYKVIDDIYANYAVQYYQFLSIKIQNSYCYSINCFMKLSTPINSYGYLTNITIINLMISSTNSFYITEKESNSVLSALISISSMQTIIVNNFQSFNNFGVTQMAIQDIESFELDEGVYDWTNEQYENQELLPCNNKIPTSYECSQRKIKFKSYNQHYLYIANFNIGVKIQNVALRRLLAIDNSLITIQSWDVEQYNTTSDSVVNEDNKFYNGYSKEILIFNNVYFISNSLVITESRSFISAIYIESQQDQIIFIQNSDFQDNHLHSLSEDQLSQSSPILIIQSPLSIVTLYSCTIENNRATRIKNALIYIVSYSLNISSTTFSQTNIRNEDWIYRLEEQQIVNYNSTSSETDDILQYLKLFFPINNIGGNLFTKSAVINIEDSTFDEAYAISGTGIYIETIEEGQITIENSQFSNQYSSLLNQYQSNGGCLYIDSSNSQLNLTITSITMNNCVARQSGGCIYLNPSTQQSEIYIVDSTFKQCQAISTAAISLEFSTSSKVLPFVSIQDTLFLDNNIANYLRNVPDMSAIDMLLLYTSSNLIYQSYGRLNLVSVIFSQISYISVLNLNYMVQVIWNDVLLANNTIFINSLVSISLYNNIGILTITSSTIGSNIQFDGLSDSSDTCDSYFLTYNSSTDIDEQTCDGVTTLDTYYRENIFPTQNQVISTDAYPLYSSTLDTQYSSLTDNEKYQLDEISLTYDPIVETELIIPIPLNFIAYETFNSDENLEFSDCYFTYILSLYSESTRFTTGIISIEQINDQQSLEIQSLNIENNNCTRCVNGLFQVYSIHQTTDTYISISDLSCTGNVIGYFGCIAFTYDSSMSDITIPMPITDYSVTRILDVVSDLLSSNFTLIIQKSNFENNRAKVGAGFMAIGLETLIIQTSFSDNNATLIGGALYYQSSNYQDSDTKVHFAQCTFEGNVAQLAGGVYISGGTIGNQSSIEVYFSDNDGTLRGDNLEEYPQKLTLTMRLSQLMKIQTFSTYSGDEDGDGFIDSTSVQIIDEIILDSYQLYNYQKNTTNILLPSGQAINSYNYYYSDTNEQIPYEWLFRIVNLDRYKQPMSNFDATQYCTVTGRLMDSNNFNDSKEFLSNYTNAQTFYYDPTLGGFNFDTLIVTFDPYFADNLYLQLKFECSSIQIPVYNTTSPYDIIGYNTNYALYANIRTLPCQLGEAYQLQKCIACTEADKTYSVTQSQTSCTVMDSTQMDDVNPTAIKLKANYWRGYFDSQTIEYCTNLPANCNGGWSPGNPSCYTGHMGAMCESCDIYGVRDEPYASSAKYKCGQCANTLTVNSLVITALSIVTLISMSLSVKGNYQMLEDFVRTRNLMSMGILVSPSQSNLAILIKLFTNYFQILSAISTFQINLSEGITNASQVLGNPTQSMSYSLDCFLIDMTSISILYFRLIWALLMPLIYLSVFFLGYFLGVLFKKIQFKEGIIYTTFIYMFLYLQPTLVGGFISLASSRTVGGYSWVQADVLFRYDTDTHYLWLGAFVAPLLILWAFLFPCIFMYLVRGVRAKLDDFESRKKLGFFYNEYTKEGYLWEFVKIFEKELIIIFLTYYEEKVVVKGLVIFLIVFFYGGFTIIFKPYQSKRLNFIDRLSTAICAASLCLGVLIYASIVDNLVYLEVIMLIIVALLNIGFILLMIYYLLEGYIIKFQPQLDKIRDRIRIHYPDISEKYPWVRKFLFNQERMNYRVKNLWALLRYETKKGIKRRRIDPQAPLFQVNHEEMLIFKSFATPDYTKQRTLLQESPTPSSSNKIYPIAQDLVEEEIHLNQINQEQ